MGISILNPSDFNKCSNIWNIKKNKKMADIWYNQLVSGERITFVYSVDGAFVGEMSIVFDNGDPDYTIPKQRVYFSRLMVKKENRRQGIGKKLCEYAIEYVKEQGYSEISIGVNLDNFAAIKLYQGLGFDRLIFVGEDADGKYIKLLKEI